MPEKCIDQLRDILAKAAARDEDLQRALQTFAAEVLKELGAGDAPPAWAELKTAHGERQLTPQFVLQEGWLRGDLVVEVTPETKLTLSLRMHATKDKTHEVGLANEPSQSVVIDPPDEKHREAARKKLLTHIYANLEGQIRQSVAFPAE